MRGLRRTVLVVLVCAATVAGVLAPTAASAATTAIHWESWAGTTLQPDYDVSVCTQDWAEDFETGQTLVVQVKLDGVYTTKKQITVDGGQGDCIDITPSTLVPGPGSYWFHAQFRPSPGAAVLTASATFKLVKTSAYASMRKPDQLYSTTASTSRRLTLDVAPPRGQVVELQRKWQGNWYTVSRVRAPRADVVAPVDIAVPPRAGNSYYRTVVRGTTWSTQDTSGAFLLHQTDSAKHRRYLASARSYIKRWCPNNPIYIDTVDVQAGAGYVGLATGEWQEPWSGGPGSLKARIELRSGLPPQNLESVALHECAHVAQFRAAVEGRFYIERDKAWDLWRNVGHEGQADCMSYVYSGTTRYFGYVDSCTSTQMKNSRRMWADYGVKYQSNPYRWSAPGSAAASGPAPEPVVIRLS